MPPRPPEVRAKITATKARRHEEYKRSVARGQCGTAGCERPGCRISDGKCHCGCGEPAPVAVDDDRTRKYVRGEPRLYVQGHQRGGDTLMAASNGDPLLSALDHVGLTRIEVSGGAKLGKGVVADLIGLEGYRLRRSHCERIVAVLREAFEAKGLDDSGLTLERLFTEERPADEPPVGERARRRKRRRPPVPANERGDGRHFKVDAERLREICEKDGLVTHERAADEILFLPRSTLSYFRERGRIEGRRVQVGALRGTVYDLRAVKELARTLRESEAAWDRRDPIAVFDWHRSHGASRDEARAAADRIAEQLKTWGRLRPGAGRKKSVGPPAHHFDWARRFVELTAELEERHAVDGSLGFTDPPPTKWEVALLVAEGDCEGHPERWAYAPGDAPRAAADRVWKAVKALQNAQSKIRAA